LDHGDLNNVVDLPFSKGAIHDPLMQDLIPDEKYLEKPNFLKTRRRKLC
jgi:hypothetical protein